MSYNQHVKDNWPKYQQMLERRNIKSGADSPYWKGENAGYVAKHNWVRNIKGTPRKCVHCGSEDKKAYDWANVSGLYKRDLDDYIRLCRSCHVKMDRNNTTIKKNGQEIIWEKTETKP